MRPPAFKPYDLILIKPDFDSRNSSPSFFQLKHLFHSILGNKVENFSAKVEIEIV
jgi:hypothetical protein